MLVWRDGLVALHCEKCGAVLVAAELTQGAFDAAGEFWTVRSDVSNDPEFAFRQEIIRCAREREPIVFRLAGRLEHDGVIRTALMRAPDGPPLAQRDWFRAEVFGLLERMHRR